ncbi:methyltransferase domain-containing protein [Mycoplasma sp. CSL10137]|uniref:class I SAM-dependent methyltransferase n=1 Tax=unclassified Mycoplasma TaxID=2683645 RepID=UPI00197BF7D3|nr:MULTISPECIES: class I SAM-dependent methyltransferase [unclassified Mycoplasma]MBN4083765.1 methyltransferase domain-containing protein [Mycoplasma sp. CSL10137]MBN4084169.1 methyltransferase domain-containing protein [Mycoplasma sp. CSL10166]MBU4692632.1 methyltransferase domain-containing protein [Mycoplasma sp. CSL7491-lung]
MNFNENNKSVFEDDQTVVRYAKSNSSIGLWKSEEFIFDKYFKNKNFKLLDIGCGTGRTTFGLIKKGFTNILGVDISSNMIDTAKYLAKNDNINVNFEIANASKLHYANNSFEYALFSFNGWPGIPSEEGRIDAINEIYRVLKSGGIFIFSTIIRNEDTYIKPKDEIVLKCSEFKIKNYGDHIFLNENNLCDFMHLYSYEELMQLLNKTKFTILEVIDRDKNFLENYKVKEFANNTHFIILKK